MSDSQTVTSAAESAVSRNPEAIPLSSSVTTLLNPITPDQPAGNDVSDHPLFMQLSMQAQNPAPNYVQWVSSAEKILEETGKDLRVAVWLAFGWYRKEGLTGLGDGLALIHELLKKYGDSLLPTDNQKRGKALRFLNAKIPMFLKKETVDTGNRNRIIAIETAFRQLESECKNRYPDEANSLKDIGAQIMDLAGKAKKLDSADTVSNAAVPAPRAAEPAEPRPVPGPQKPASGGASPDGRVITSEKDSVLRIKQALLYFFEEQKEGSKVQKIPSQGLPYALSRSLVWTNLRTPVSKNEITEIDGPAKERIAFLSARFAESDWDVLIPSIETDFLMRDGVRYWLDGQRFVVLALSNKGEAFGEAAGIIKMHLAKLVQRNPNLPKLIFKDKQTPFAGNETLQWIDDEIRPLMGEGKQKPAAHFPVLNEEYDSIKTEYETALAALPQGFEEYAKTMQRAMDGDTRRKGRFLRTLSLANYCFQAKKYSLASIFLKDLREKIDAFQLAQWEPSLCVAVWQAAFMNNRKLIETENREAPKAALWDEQKELYLKIGAFDCVMAQTISENS